MHAISRGRIRASGCSLRWVGSSGTRDAGSPNLGAPVGRAACDDDWRLPRCLVGPCESPANLVGKVVDDGCNQEGSGGVQEVGDFV